MRRAFLLTAASLALTATAAPGPYDEVVYATHAGELADARKMGEQGIPDFFAKVSAAVPR